jgi:hypothetical protein
MDEINNNNNNNNNNNKKVEHPSRIWDKNMNFTIRVIIPFKTSYLNKSCDLFEYIGSTKHFRIEY